MYSKSRRLRHYNENSLENGFRRTSFGLNRTLYRSSPNLAATSKYELSDDDNNDDYGFLKVNHRKPTHLPPKIPPLPKEYQEQLLHEQQQKQYWENIQQRLYDFCRSRHNNQNRGNSMATRAKEKQQQHSSLQASNNVKSQRNQSVPLQPSNSSDRNRKKVKDKFSNGDQVTNRKNSTSAVIDFVDDADSTEEEAELFLKNYEKLLQEEEDIEKSYSNFENPLCVKCLVQFFNNQSTSTCDSTMSRVSLPFFF